MHDPFTVAAEWPRYGTRAYKLVGPQFTLWHRDKGGNDGACGWSFPRLTDEQIRSLKMIAWSEGRDPYWLRSPGKQFHGARAEAESLYRGLVLCIARMLNLKMTFDQAALWTAERIHNGGISDRANAFCFQPGYHTNSQADTPEEREHVFIRTVFGIARELLAERRPWYRHPRWHVHHWRLQIHKWQTLRRCLFDRCSICGGRFTWGYCPTSDWNGTRRWHGECDGKRSASSAGQKP